MSSFMNIQLILHGKGLVTNVTFKRLLTSVDSSMLLEVARIAKSFVTNITFMLLVASVYFHMSGEVSTFVEFHFANLAFVKLHIDLIEIMAAFILSVNDSMIL